MEHGGVPAGIVSSTCYPSDGMVHALQIRGPGGSLQSTGTLKRHWADPMAKQQQKVHCTHAGITENLWNQCATRWVTWGLSRLRFDMKRWARAPPTCTPHLVGSRSQACAPSLVCLY
jgi:hypothetical protein